MTSHLNFDVDPTNDNQKSVFHNFLQNRSFVDVTLVCDDNKYVQAHKVILSSISEVFSNILLNYNIIPNVGNSLLYMKGVKHDSLQQILDFIYKGKTSVPMNKLADFMTLAKDLKITGLLEDDLKASSEQNVDDESQNESSDTVPIKSHTNLERSEEPSTNLQIEVTSSENSLNDQEVNIKSEKSDDHETKQDVKNGNIEDEYRVIKIKNGSANKECTHSEYRQLIDSHVEIKEPGNFQCKECQFVSANKGLVRQHAETHCVDFRFICKHCGEIFKREIVVQSHVKEAHTISEEAESTQVKKIDHFKPRMKQESYMKEYAVKRSNVDVATGLFSHVDVTHSEFGSLIDSMYERRAAKEFVCKQCNFTATKNPHMREHVETHLDSFEFTCKQCGKTTKRTRDIHIHIRKVHIFDRSETKYLSYFK